MKVEMKPVGHISGMNSGWGQVDGHHNCQLTSMPYRLPAPFHDFSDFPDFPDRFKLLTAIPSSIIWPSDRSLYSKFTLLSLLRTRAEVEGWGSQSRTSTGLGST
jgi:hypothetical protein